MTLAGENESGNDSEGGYEPEISGVPVTDGALLSVAGNPYQPSSGPLGTTIEQPVSAIDEGSGADDGRPLSKDLAFVGMVITQFLGAFNDNVFKFLIIFVVLTTIKSDQTAALYQTLANMLFASPFILFSGFAGFLADKNAKRTIIISSKVAEIVLMVLGTFAFLTGLIWPLLLMLFLMGLQTTFFSPGKYGILPEMLRKRDLSMANGIISMTTFLAIIFGTVVGGVASELARTRFGGNYWAMNFVCVAVAVGGTVSALLLRGKPAANPNLRFTWRDVLIAADTMTVLRHDRRLLAALVVNAVFWFLAGVVQPTINEFGIKQLALGETKTSILSGVLGLGIAAGFSVAGLISRGLIRFSLLRWGVLGVFVSLMGVAIGTRFIPSQSILYAVLLACFFITGLSTGLFALPLVTYLQSRPPAEHKGRVIAAMNLLSWIGILLAAGFYFVCSLVLSKIAFELSWTFAIVAILMTPLAFAIAPVDEAP